jgi:hypothetical protein
MLTIGVIVLAVLGVVGIPLAMTLLRGRGRRVVSAALTTTGTSQVWEVALPQDTLVFSRAALALLWVVKLRWLLNSEPVHTREALTEIVDDSPTLFRAQYGSAAEAMEEQKLALQLIGLGGTQAGVVLSIDVFYAPHGAAKWLINNNFPRAVTHGDLIWSVVNLFDEVFQSMAPHNQGSLLNGARRFGRPAAQRA